MVEFGRIGKFHELTPGSDGKLYSGGIQVRTEIRHGRPLRLLGKQDRADNPLHLLFSLESGYEWGKGLSHEKTDAFYKEIKEKFHGEGFDTDRTGCTSQAMYLVKGKTRLYVHPMEISGYCETLHIPQITAILKKGGRTFRLVKDTIAEEVYSFTDEEELEYYRARYGTCIHRNILDAFSNRHAGKEDILSMMASRINVATTSHLYGIGYDSPAYRFVHEAYDRLVNNGKLKEDAREIGCCNIIMAISNTNAI